MGRLSFYLASFVKKVVGIDISGSMIDAACNLKGNVRNAEFLIHTGQEIEFSDESFNAIFSVWVLQHIDNDELRTLAREFFRVTQTGGQLVFLEQTAARHSVFNQIHVQRTVDEYIAIFESAGYKTITVEPVFRMPSYAMDLWKKYAFLSFLGPRPFAFLEHYSLKRKIHLAAYLTNAFVFEKPAPENI